MWTFKLICLLLVLSVTLLSGLYPFFKKFTSEKDQAFPIAEALAAGVFLSVALIHMLGTASAQFYKLSYHYPFAFLLAGVMFLFLLLLEHIGREIVSHKGDASGAFAILATIMLSVHAFLMGTALGLSATFSVAFILLLAILAHKWAESFSLAIQINKSNFSFKMNTFLFCIFSLMTPIGIVLGAAATTALNNYPLLEPIFSSLAAGTFLYLGTLHGLENATLVKQCCDLKRFYFVILGFAIMAVVAIWT
ncbi:MAG TPA: ZIP family metal transporter [Coxiellaceae bacterium]|nr:MAG: zinc transporter [Gammaproteobacteria bacterium RIFCSPHIGHO2_12_FULL_36_30]HLB56402.1 ZIP family metal transporter [Coxiellaceae bacterium]